MIYLANQGIQNIQDQMTQLFLHEKVRLKPGAAN